MYIIKLIKLLLVLTRSIVNFVKNAENNSNSSYSQHFILIQINSLRTVIFYLVVLHYVEFAARPSNVQVLGE